MKTDYFSFPQKLITYDYVTLEKIGSVITKGLFM